MIKITLIAEKISLDIIGLFDRWIYLNKKIYPEIVGEIITSSNLPKGFWEFENISSFISK